MNTITTTCKHLYVSGGYNSPSYINTSNPGSGTVRYYNNFLQVYDGFSWVNITNNNTTTLCMTPSAESALDWAMKKMSEEYENERLAQTVPAIKDLLNQISEKQEQIKTIKILINESNKTY